MADATQRVVLKTSARGTGSYIVADGITVYEGMLAQLESGYLNHWDETGSFLGVVQGGDDRLGDGVITGETSDNVPPEARVDESGITLMHRAVGGSPTQASVGALVFCADSDVANLTVTDTTNPPVGWLKYFRSASDCDVRLFTPEEHAAGIADGTWNA